MLDLETLSTGNNAVIVQIGACYFDNKTGDIGDEFSINVDIDSAMETGLTVDGDTIKWWMEQSDEARSAVFTRPQKLVQALTDFNKFVKNVDDVIWSHATFDFVILMNAYEKSGIKSKFSYKSDRDIRTLVNMPGIKKKEFPPVGIHHNALDDCRFQVQYVVDYLNQLRKI